MSLASLPVTVAVDGCTRELLLATVETVALVESSVVGDAAAALVTLRDTVCEDDDRGGTGVDEDEVTGRLVTEDEDEDRRNGRRDGDRAPDRFAFLVAAVTTEEGRLLTGDEEDDTTGGLVTDEDASAGTGE